VPNFATFAASITELAHGEKSHTQSLTQSITHSFNHSPSLFDAPGMEALALWNIRIRKYQIALLPYWTNMNNSIAIQCFSDDCTATQVCFKVSCSGDDHIFA